MISLKSKIAIKILEVFFFNEKDKFYINELAKKIKEDPANVHKKLSQMKEKGLLIDEYQGKERYFSLNKNYPFLKEYKKIILQDVGFEKKIKEELGKISGIKDAYLFGSYAGGNFVQESDIDILIIGTFDFKELQKSLINIQKMIGREINSLELSSKEFEDRKKKNDPLLSDIFSKKTIKIL